MVDSGYERMSNILSIISASRIRRCLSYEILLFAKSNFKIPSSRYLRPLIFKVLLRAQPWLIHRRRANVKYIDSIHVCFIRKKLIRK